MPQEKVLLVQALVYEMKMKIEALASRLPVGVLAKQKKTTGIPEYVTGIPLEYTLLEASQGVLVEFLWNSCVARTL
jgi:hypothetical protein